MKIILKNKNRRLELDVKKCSKFCMFRGLMFRNKEKAGALLFDFKKPAKTRIHSWFVLFPFAVLWLDRDGRVLGSEIVKPFRTAVGINRPFSKIIEIPANKKHENVVRFLQIPDGRKI